MNETVYGVNLPNSCFTFDKVYENAADARTKAATDGVLIGRYILIKYCDTAFDQNTRTHLDAVAKGAIRISGRTYTAEENNYISNCSKDLGVSKDRHVYRKEYIGGSYVYKEIAQLNSTLSNTAITVLGVKDQSSDNKQVLTLNNDGLIETTLAFNIGKKGNNYDELQLLGVNGQVISRTDFPKYSISKDNSSNDFAAVYHLTRDGENVGAAINIPKDMVVKSGVVVENPEGQEPGTYIELTLQNVTEHLFINVGDLIEYVTSGSAAGDMVVVNISNDHRVTATITNGTVTLEKLDAGVQESLSKADDAATDLATLKGGANVEGSIANSIKTALSWYDFEGNDIE